MNTYYYIPVNSLNFNNVLSSESISPVSFYEKRGFGFKRFERINANPLQNSILAYNKIPLLSDIRSDREEYPFYIAVPEKYFEGNYSRKSSDNIDIIQMDKSIYINWMECFFFTRNEEEKKKIIASTRRSIEVKNIDNYISSIYVLETYDIESFIWNESIIADISDTKNSNQAQILRDQKINKFKGFIYAYVSGKQKEQPEEMAEGSRYFQEFINSYSALLNDLSVLSRNYKGKKASFNYSSADKTLGHLTDIKERIEILFGAFEQSDLDELIEQKFHTEKSEIEILKKLQYQNSRITVYSMVCDFLKDKDNSLFSIDELLEDSIDNIKYFLKNPSLERHKELKEGSDKFTALINKKIGNYRSVAAKQNALDAISVDIKDDLAEIKTDLNEISQYENSVYSLIINEVLSRIELSTSDEIAQCRQGIIQNVADSIKSSKGENDNSLDYLRKLYKSLTKVGIGFKIDESEDNALKSLACFLSRYSEMEKLQDFMDRNKFYHYGLSFGIWGAAYGYANISKILTESLNSDNEKLILITKYINKTILSQEIDENNLKVQIESFGERKTQPSKPLWKIKVERLNQEERAKESKAIESTSIDSKQNKEENKPPTNKDSQLDIFQIPEEKEYLNTEGPVVVDLKVKNDNDSNKEQGFMDLIKQDELIGKRADWIALIKASFNQFNKEFEMNPEMGLGSIKHEFERFLDEEKHLQDIKGFGPQKINKAVKIFMTYIQSNG